MSRWAELLGISDKAVLNTHEAAAVLRISERSLRQGIYDGTIPFVRLGRRILIPVPVLLRALLDGDLQRAA
ncbi:MAG: helix-turn-helix domain-containing protein [Acidimicrobiales bacterium]